MAAPVVSVGNRSLPSNHWQKFQPWITYSDADGNPAVSYQFFDGVRLFKDNEAQLLGRIGASIIDRISPVASRLSDLTPKDIKQLAGELKNDHSADT